MKNLIRLKIFLALSMFVFPYHASAHIKPLEVKRIACNGYTYILTDFSGGSMDLIQLGARTINFSGMKFHTKMLKEVLKNGSDFDNAVLECEKGDIKLIFPNNITNQTQSILLLKSGRILDVTVQTASKN